MSEIEITPISPENPEKAVKAATKNFRNAIEIERLYRFLNDNDLRREAKKVFEVIIAATHKKANRKKKNSSN